MKNKLKSMVDYVLEKFNNLTDIPTQTEAVKCCLKNTIYANFLSQKPEIWMFVACKLINGEWEVLKHPIEPEHPYNDKECDVWEQYLFYLNRYQEAKEHCIFKGFEVEKITMSYSIQIANKISNQRVIFWKNGRTLFENAESQSDILTIEDLVKYNITLIDKEAKRLEL